VPSNQVIGHEEWLLAHSCRAREAMLSEGTWTAKQEALFQLEQAWRVEEMLVRLRRGGADRRLPPKLTPKQDEKARQLIAAGVTRRAVAGLFSISSATVRDAINRAERQALAAAG
jgi:hypothetical protein